MIDDSNCLESKFLCCKLYWARLREIFICNKTANDYHLHHKRDCKICLTWFDSRSPNKLPKDLNKKEMKEKGTSNWWDNWVIERRSKSFKICFKYARPTVKNLYAKDGHSEKHSINSHIHLWPENHYPKLIMNLRASYFYVLGNKICLNPCSNKI